MSNLSIGSLLERDFILREVIRSVNIEITTRKRTESREGGSERHSVKFALPSHTIVGAQNKVLQHSYPYVRGGGRDGSMTTRRNSFRKIDPSLSRSRTTRVPLKLRLLDLDPSQGYHYLGKEEPGDQVLLPHFKERDPVTRFNLFRGIEAWATDPSRIFSG